MVTRQTAKARNATVNRELSTLKRAFRLAKRAGHLTAEPYVPMLKENNTRQGFFERHQFEAVLAKLPAFLRPLAVFFYWTGWRKSEALTLQVRQVDVAACVMRLEPGTTKNREGRQFYFGALTELRDVLTAQIASAEQLSRTHDRIVSAVFHRADGLPIKSFRKAWATACKEAGYPTMLVHDFRRTAVRNLERAGVPRSTAMQMVGHKTEAVYRRYAIVDEASHREGGEKYGAFADGKPAASSAATCTTVPPSCSRRRKVNKGTTGEVRRVWILRRTSTDENRNRIISGAASSVVEHLTFNQRALGSIPRRPTSFRPPYRLAMNASTPLQARSIATSSCRSR